MVKSINPKKLFLARIFSWTGLDEFMFRGQKLLWGNDFIRIVNYHGTPQDHREQLRRQFQFYSEKFCPVSYPNLVQYLRDGHLSMTKPGLIVSFDDGLRSNFDVAYPLLQEYGLCGWFCIPSDFVGLSVKGDDSEKSWHTIRFDNGYQDRRVAMSWDELRVLTQHNHVICSHTKTHYRMSPPVNSEVLEKEICDSKRILEDHLGDAVNVFCWVGGESHSYSTEAAREIRTAGYKFCFTTLTAAVRPGADPFQLHRTNIEAAWPLEVVRFQLCGLMDLAYIKKRRRVVKLTSLSE